ncbi:MAG: hypothetical protein LBS41_00235 [Streptococcaceae bacterium]|jgi:hypothetical protein|nr:hypothetical protein [Streptococcaceae bacterium]
MQKEITSVKILSAILLISGLASLQGVSARSSSILADQLVKVEEKGELNLPEKSRVSESASDQSDKEEQAQVDWKMTVTENKPVRLPQLRAWDGFAPSNTGGFNLANMGSLTFDKLLNGQEQRIERKTKSYTMFDMSYTSKKTDFVGIAFGIGSDRIAGTTINIEWYCKYGDLVPVKLSTGRNYLIQEAYVPDSAKDVRIAFTDKFDIYGVVKTTGGIAGLKKGQYRVPLTYTLVTRDGKADTLGTGDYPAEQNVYRLAIDPTAVGVFVS